MGSPAEKDGVPGQPVSRILSGTGVSTKDGPRVDGHLSRPRVSTRLERSTRGSSGDEQPPASLAAGLASA